MEIALKDGANSLEFDLCITKDNEIVLWHDWDPNNTISFIRENGLEPFVKCKPSYPPLYNDLRKSVNELTLEEFKANYNYKIKESGELAKVNIPTLKDFFEWSKNKNDLLYACLDLKIPPENAELVIPFSDCLKELLEKYKPKFKIVIETTYHEVLKILKEQNLNCAISLDIEPPAGFIFLPRLYGSINAAIKNHNTFAIALRPTKITIGNWITHRRIINYDVGRRFAFNKKNPENKIEYLMSCTVNKPNELKCLAKLGIGGVQTDYPERLIEIVEKLGRKTK